MIYAKYGLTFRKIRETKKLSLSIFPKIGISKPALSKFERGETMMGFESVVCALQEMGVSLEEYEHFLNAYTLGEEESFWEELETAAFEGSEEGLVALQEKIQDAGFYYMSLAVKACYNRLTPQEAEEVTDYLYEVEIWSVSELRLFYFCMENLSQRDILHILGAFFPEGHELFNSKKHRQQLVKVSCRAVTQLSLHGYQREARMLLEQLEAHALTQTMFQRNLKNMTEGFWVHRFVDPQEGEKKVREGLGILQAISPSEEVAYYEKRYALMK